MRIDVITIFPEMFDCFLKESIISRAQKQGLIFVKAHNLRKWAKDKHKSVDDKPFGGGRGMVLKVEPIYRAVQELKQSKFKIQKSKIKMKNQNTKIILFTPRGQKFDQKIAYQLSKLDRLILICGRYEGVDERVAKHIADLELSIGDYVLMGGEVPAMAAIEAVTRLVPSVLGKSELLPERYSKGQGRGGKGFIEYPQYTRPEIFSPKKGIKWPAPKILLSGNHRKIAQWRQKHSIVVGAGAPC